MVTDAFSFRVDSTTMLGSGEKDPVTMHSHSRNILITEIITAIARTNSMEKSPQEANNTQLVNKFPAFSGRQRFITVFTRTYPTMSHMNSFCTLICFKIHFNIILSSRHRSPKWSFLPRFLTQNYEGIFHLSYVYYMPSPSHPEFDYPNMVKSTNYEALILGFFPPP
jgi:hypothetical protein